MASRNFNRKQGLEKEVKDIYLKTQYSSLIQASGTLDLTTDAVLTKAAGGAANNSATFEVVVNVAAANPTDTVLATFSGTAAAIVCTITPNDGTNNTATPVDLTTAELVELINNGSVVGKTVTVTDASSLRNDQTATGGDTTVLVNGGEGDGVTATFAGGQDQAFTNITKRGVSSIAQTAPGTYRITLEDRYISLKMLNVEIIDSAAKDLNPQIKAEAVNNAVPTVDFYLNTGATPTNPADGDILLISLELKNTSVA